MGIKRGVVVGIRRVQGLYTGQGTYCGSRSTRGDPRRGDDAMEWIAVNVSSSEEAAQATARLRQLPRKQSIVQGVGGRR